MHRDKLSEMSSQKKRTTYYNRFKAAHLISPCIVLRVDQFESYLGIMILSITGLHVSVWCIVSWTYAAVLNVLMCIRVLSLSDDCMTKATRNVAPETRVYGQVCVCINIVMILKRKSD